MNKNYSGNSLSVERDRFDFYQTPYSLTELLMENYFFPKSHCYYDPACGDGAITKILKKRMSDVKGTDIKEGEDFLKMPKKIVCDWIITNPPFKKFNEFVLKSFEVAKEGCVIFGKLDFLSGKNRFEKIYKMNPPNLIIVFTRKTMLEATAREDGKFRTGIDAMCWYIWEYKNLDKRTNLQWVDNDKYVLRRGDV